MRIYQLDMNEGWWSATKAMCEKWIGHGDGVNEMHFIVVIRVSPHCQPGPRYLADVRQCTEVAKLQCYCPLAPHKLLCACIKKALVLKQTNVFIHTGHNPSFGTRRHKNMY